MSDDAVILALDTSGGTASVAVYQGRVLAETTWCSGRRHSSELLGGIDATLRLARLDKGALGAVAAAIGPGSYSGLRVGITTAMGIGLALGIGVVPVPTLEAMAYGHGSSGRPVRAAIDVGRGRYATARFRRVQEGVQQDTEILGMTLAEVLALAAQERAVVVADLDLAAPDLSAAGEVPGPQVASPALSVRRAGLVAELAALKLRSGEVPGSATPAPIYLR